jgi:large subunit ribosomal protein L15
MKAPFQPQPRDPRKAFECNSNPAKLDNMYNKLLGRNDSDSLSEELKWLAVTHKSFDQGRRGFNDRLAYFGTPPSTHRGLIATFLTSNPT